MNKKKKRKEKRAGGVTIVVGMCLESMGLWVEPTELHTHTHTLTFALQKVLCRNNRLGESMCKAHIQWRANI
jgi:hypothetical protein